MPDYSFGLISIYRPPVDGNNDHYFIMVCVYFVYNGEADDGF